MLAVRLLGNSHAKVVQIPRPKAGKGWVVVKTKASALCGGELHPYSSNEERKGISGHEVAGQVVEVGQGVSEIRAEDRVALYAVASCGKCEFCRRGDWASCKEPREFISGQHIQGGHAEYLAVPERICFPLPDDLSFEQGALLGDGVGTPYHAIKRLAINGTHTVALFGLGPVGLGALLILKLLNCKVIAVEIGEYRQELAKSLGADRVIDPKEQDPVDAIKECTEGEGADMAIDCAGKEITENQALDCAKKGGKVAFVGQNKVATIQPSRQFLDKELTLIGSFYYDVSEYKELIALIRRGLNPERIITHRFGLEEAQKAFSTFASGKSGKVVFVPDITSPEEGVCK